MFQERYIETVICRIFYEASCASGKMSLRQFQKSLFSTRIKTLGNNVELNNTQDYFSYKHFYVLYCKFWTLDNDHDLMLTAEDLFQYNEQALNPRVIERLVSYGQIQAFSRNRTQKQQLTYLDYIWFLLHEVDKTSPKAIEYWFRMLDEDGDGVLSGYELEMYWQEQMDKQKLMFHEFEEITFDDILRQMCDLIQPATYGQFTLMDLKKNGFFAERFLDTFLHLEKFTLHECIQGCVRLKLQEGNYDTTYLCGWDRYTEMEYQQLIAMDQIAMASGVKDDEEEESDSAPGTPTSDASMSQDKDEEPEHVDWKLSWLAKSQALQDAS
ncbi:hypothetical protein BC940DRAFT_32778 [Gongronella butleri]|nr:hypothetical protein BC940DRAFT_32778 [Gongronella butleri]